MSNRQLHLQQSPQRLDDGKCGGGGATEILEFPTVAIPTNSLWRISADSEKKEGCCGPVDELCQSATSFRTKTPFKGHLLRIL